jgi:hypothetical protein
MPKVDGALTIYLKHWWYILSPYLRSFRWLFLAFDMDQTSTQQKHLSYARINRIGDNNPTSTWKHDVWVADTLISNIQSSMYKCYPYKHYNFIYDKKILLPYKNTIGKTSECYVLSVITCSTPFFVNYTSISVNIEKIKLIIYESIHFKHVITFIPYSLRTSQVFSLV